MKRRAVHLDGVRVDHSGRGVENVFEVELFLGLPVHHGVREPAAGLEEVDDIGDPGALFVEFGREPELAGHVPGEVHLAGRLGEQVVRNAGLVRAGAAEERPGIDDQLPATARPQVGRSEPAGCTATDENGVVLPVVLLRCRDIPERLGVLGGVRDDVVDQQRPLADGERIAWRAAVPAHRFTEGVDPSAQCSETIRGVAYIDH